ncbi:hypothetical protein B484DRAFT_461918, partial [Ochromonadaceae sp. CCMP2298]
MKNYAKIFNGAQVIAAAARGVLGDITEGKIAVTIPPTDDKEEDYFYDRLALVHDEVEWFTARKTNLQVLQLAVQAYADAEEWALFPNHVLSAGALAKQEEIKATSMANAAAAHEMSVKLITLKKMKHVRPGVAVLSHDDATARDGPKTAADKPPAKAKAAKVKVGRTSKNAEFATGVLNAHSQPQACSVTECGLGLGTHGCTEEGCDGKGYKYCDTHKKHGNHVAHIKRTQSA